MELPPYIRTFSQSSVAAKKWVDSLAAAILNCREKWGLELGKPFEKDATCSFVAPAKRKDGSSAIFKLGFPHLEALHEIEGLSFLQENVSVKLYDFDKEYNALLLEKCEPGMHLRNEPEEKQDEILAEIFPRLWNTDFSAAIFRPLKEMVDQWNQETKEALATFPDKELALKGCRLKDELIESTKRHKLLATDLHAGNVLSAQRKPWLVIDVKPYVGDPHYDLTQHLLNCMDRVELKGKEVIQKLAKACKLEEIRLQKWFYARLISEQEGVHQKLAQELFPEFQ